MASYGNLIFVDEPRCESFGTEQQMGSEILVESVSEQNNCLEAQPLLDRNADLASEGDGSPGFCRNDNAGCVSCSEVTELGTGDRGGLAGGGESTSVMEPEDFLNSEYGINRCGLDENQKDVDGCSNIESGGMQLKEGWCREDGFAGSFDDCEVPSEDIPSTGSPGNGIQLDQHRDDKSANRLSSEGMMEVMEEQGELPLEFVDIDVCRDYTIFSGNSLEAAFEKSVALTGIEVGGSCDRISPARDGGMPSEVSNTGGLVTDCNQNKEHIDDNGVSGVSGLSTEKSTEVSEACNQMLPSLSFQRSLEDLHMPNSPSNFAQQRDSRSNNTVDGSLADRATEFMEEKSNVMTEKEAEIHTQISFVKVNVSCLKENSSNVAPICIIENSVPPQSCNAFSFANNSVDGLYADGVTVVVDMKSNIVDACNQTLPPDLLSVCTQENDQGSDKVKECVEQQVDGTTDTRVETGTQILLKEEKASNLTKDSAGLFPNSTIENSVPLQLHQPFDIVSNDSSKMLDVPDINDSPGHVESSTSFDHSGLMDHEGNDNFRVEFFSKTNFSEIIALPAQRNGRRRKTPTKKAPRKRRNASKVLQPLGSVESVFKGAGRKRSCLSKPPRSSTWGLLGRVTQSFEESNGLQVHQVCQGQNEGSQKRRGGRRSGKQKQSVASGNFQGSRGTSTNHVRLKVKFGKEVDKYNKAAEFVDTSACANSIQIVNVVEDNWRQEATVGKCQHSNKKLEEDETCQDGELANKDLETLSVAEISAEDEIQNCLVVPSHAIALSSGGSVGSSYRDPGTSPDSEVINLIPEAHVEARPQEDSHGTDLTSDKVLSASGDFISSKRGKKKHKLPYAGNCVPEDGSLCPCPASTMRAKPSTRDGCRQNGSQDICSGETFTSSPGAKASTNSSSDRDLSVEPLCLSGGSDHGVERGAEAETDCILDVGLGLHSSHNVIPSSNTKGQKPPKGKSRGSDSASKRSNTRKPREKEQKSVNKKKVKEDKQLACKVESLPESGDPLADANTSHVAECIGVPNLDVAPGDLDKQYVPPRNAWVLCDACNKWRRIPAELADFIDETKCTWTCRENQDRNFADCSIPQEKSNAEINAELEISDASGEEDASGTRLHYKTLECRRPSVSQQNVASIKTNQFLHRNRKNQSIDEIMVCHCKLPKDGQLGCGEDCLNRMLNIECVRGTCPCGDLCSNQQFQKRRYSKLEKFRSGKKGFGLRSLEYICKGQFLIEYVGEVLDTYAYEARQKEYAVKGHRHFYFMTLNTSEVIDACAKSQFCTNIERTTRMVQLMTPRKVTVKFDVDESSEDSRLAPFHKRPKLDSFSALEQQWGSGGGGGATCAVSPLAYDLLEEPSPLGLQLRKSPSLLDLIQMKLTQQKDVKLANKKNHKGAAAASGGGTDKLKAMNFPASLLRIGTWEYKSKYEGDLVAKCYFAKHKLVWEVLDGSLKNKMEIQWSDIVAIKANYPDEGQATLDVALARPPLFFRETNPQPRKHTLWQATTDFTDGQASINKRHFLQCPHGLLFGKHFEKLIQCDPRLNFLSQQPEIVLESPFFEARVSGTSDADEYRHHFSSKLEDGPIFGLQGSASPSGTHSSSSRNEDFPGRAPENYSREISSSSSVMDTPAIAEKGNFGAGISKMPSKFDQIRVPGLRSSMSVSDFVSHIGNCITEKMSGTPMYAGKEQPSSDILEEITQYLFNDSQLGLPSDEQSLMSRVNSLCCLLQKDPTTVQNLHARTDDGRMAETNSASASGYQSKIGEGFATPKIEVTDISDDKQPGIPRRDSFGELLLNIPRIASLPQFLFNFS